MSQKLRLRVAVVVPSINAGAGARKSATVVAKALESEYEVVVISFNRHPRQKLAVTHHVCLGSEKRRFRGWRAGLEAVLKPLRRARAVAAFCHEQEIDVAVGVLTNPLLALSRLVYRNPAALIFSVRNNPQGYEFKRPLLLRGLYRLAFRALYSQAESVVAITLHMKQILENRYRLQNTRLIYNMYESRSRRLGDGEEPRPVKRSAGSRDPGNVVFLNVARMSRQKGQMHLVRSFAKIAQDCPQAELWLVGRGTLFPFVTQLVHDLNLEGRVRLLGRRDDVPELLEQADVFVLSSLWEGLPLTLLEALEANLPIIAADCPTGPREILAPGIAPEQPLQYPFYGEFGVLTPHIGPYRPPEQLLKQPLLPAERVLADVLRQFAQPGSAGESYPQVQRRVHDFSYETIGAEWCELVREVAEGKRGGKMGAGAVSSTAGGA